MKYIICFLLMVCSLKCIDKDKDRFAFIDSLLNNPDNFEKIIKDSKYFDERLRMNFDKDFIVGRVNYIKTYFYQEKYEAISDTLYYKTVSKENEEIKIFKNIIHIKSKSASLYFTFYFIEDKWVLVEIGEESGLLKNIDGMY
jgi:hypothetical protein